MEGMTRRGRPRKGWKEEAERDLQVLGVKRCKELVADRKNGRALFDRPKPIVGCSVNGGGGGGGRGEGIIIIITTTTTTMIMIIIIIIIIIFNIFNNVKYAHFTLLNTLLLFTFCVASSPSMKEKC